MVTVTFKERKLPYAVNEEVKQLRTNIKFSGDDKKVIMLTSSVASEGKSSVSLDLANSFRDLGSKVLLIDADMRKSMFKHYLEDPEKIRYGLSHLLSGQCNINDALYVSAEGVAFIFAGPVPPNPSELLSNNKMELLIGAVRDYFDYIIIDCPPLGAVIDAAVIAKYCDGAIVVIHAGKIPYKVAQEVLRQLKDSGVPILGAVINMVDMKRRGYYYKNYYYKKYGSYYAKTGEAYESLVDDEGIGILNVSDLNLERKTRKTSKSSKRSAAASDGDDE